MPSESEKDEAWAELAPDLGRSKAFGPLRTTTSRKDGNFVAKYQAKGKPDFWFEVILSPSLFLEAAMQNGYFNESEKQET